MEPNALLISLNKYEIKTHQFGCLIICFLYNLDNQVFSLEIVDIQFFDIIKIHWSQHRTDFNESSLWVNIDQLYTMRVLKLLA